MRLIIGPTSAGKSRYIQQMQDASPDAPPAVHFAFELKGDLPTGENDVVHYNAPTGTLAVKIVKVAAS